MAEERKSSTSRSAGDVERKPAETDALGQDKRRPVVGRSYGPSVAKQITLYGIFLAVLAALVIGGKLLADELDAPPKEYADRAVWQGNSVEPPPLDFPRNGSR
jgi:hypothetical protein